MNKEEIEKEDKEHIIKVLTEYKDYIFEFDDDNIKIEHILDYIRELEFNKKASEKVHNYDMRMIDEVKGEAVKLYKKIDELEEENEEKDKQIDLMAEYISKIDIEEDVCMKNKTNPEWCNEDYTNCKNCIKQNFKKLAKEKEE